MTIEQAVAEVRSVVYQMAERYGALDADGVLAMFVGEDPMLVGTGADEVRFGSAETRLQIVRDMSEVDGLSMSMENLRVKVFGESAFAYSDLVINASVGEESLKFPVRTTIGLIRTSDGWRITQIHTSVPYGEQAPGRSFPVQLTKTLSDLLTSIDSDSGSSALKAVKLGTATILFTDVVDSTRLSQSMGDQKWSELIMAHFNTLKEIVEDEGGYVVKTLGDGGMFAFPSGASALLAAVRTQRAVTASADDGLRVRIGIHTGDVIQGHNDYIGLTVNKAARVAAAAQGDQILVSSTTADIVNSTEIEFGDPITVELKGIEGTHTLRALHWAL
ncbi:MAG: adenylate/guanylate cyclase domain-containing protein [Acidimicrobiia bacterium]|jgi:class 3 adenylate cyclase/ketosteroid isomerase-like protein